MSFSRAWAVIGNPENRRVEYFVQALASLGQPSPLVLSYHDLLTHRRSVEEIPAGAIVRIDSPGENFEVEKLMLANGIAAAEEEGSPVLGQRQLDQLEFDQGRILPTRQWYLGFRETLQGWHHALAERTDLILANSPAEIAILFDKPACHRRFLASGVAVPQALDEVFTWDDLLAGMERQNWSRVFLKPAHSSSASGVVALHRRGAVWEAITSVELVAIEGELRMYNSLKLRRYTDPDEIRRLVETLLPHRLHVEQWLPKAALDRRVCDLRVLAIAGQPQHCVVRTSRSPLTNLHLGNRRGDLAAFQAKIAPHAWEAAMETCRHAAACFAGSVQVGLDLLFTPGFRSHAILEANAFGDLIPNVLHEGRDTYQAQVAAILEGWLPRKKTNTEPPLGRDDLVG